MKAGELAGIIVFRWDRFGRNLRESLAMIEEIEAAGGRVISATEPVGEGSGGVLTRDMMLAVANFYRLRIQEGWVATHDRLHERGVTNGRLPSGYPRGADGLFVPNEFAGDVRWAFEARAGGVVVSRRSRGSSRVAGVRNGAGSSRWYPHAWRGCWRTGSIWARCAAASGRWWRARTGRLLIGRCLRRRSGRG